MFTVADQTIVAGFTSAARLPVRSGGANTDRCDFGYRVYSPKAVHRAKATGTHNPDRREPDSLAVIDLDQTARIARFIYYVIRDVADAKDPPRLTVEGMQRLRKTRSLLGR